MNRMLLGILIPLAIACGGTSQSQKQAVVEPAVPSLQQVWATDTLLRTPESVLFDREREVIYVANVNMNPWEKDENGFLSKIDLDGNIAELEWITGLSGPKGMGIRGNSLFVADIDEVVEIDIEAGEIINRYPGEGEPTFNDVTVFQNEVYISGSNSNTLFKLTEDSLSIILDGDLGRPNGLFAEADRLLMITSTSSQLISIDKETMNQTPLVDSLGHGDGIVPVGNGDYLASSWRGELFYLTAEWKRHQLLDTQADQINSADIDYVIGQNLLLVPTFFDNRVVAYQLVE